MNYLFFDTETTGLPDNNRAHYTNIENWPRIVQISWIIADSEGNVKKESDFIVKVDCEIPADASEIHGITNEIAAAKGVPISDVLTLFLADLEGVEKLISHNVDFDLPVLKSELYRNNFKHDFDLPTFCTMKSATDFCQIPGNRGYKWPRLDELYSICFDKELHNAHNALVDVRATLEVFYHLKREQIFEV